MNYTLQKVNCKVLFGVAISLATAFIFSVQAYAYEMVLIPNFVLDNNYVYVAKGVSPRTASLSSVSISYDSLADLVYYCNEHGLSTSLVYNSAVDAYVGWVNDSAINITGFSYTTLNGLLGNNAGKVYVAQDSNSAGTGDINSPSHWMSFPSISPVISPVSYDALCRIVLDLNAVQQPAEITTYSYGNTTYYVVISDGGRSAGKYYCSLDGRIYAIPADKADISLTIQVWCYQIKNKLVGLSDYIQNTLDSKLDTLTSVISNGKVLVDNSDVVSAIQSIPAFDDAELLSGLSALGATATRIADAIDYNFGQYSGTHTFPSLDKRQFYVYGDKAELFEDISGQVLYSSSERLSTFSYTRDYDGMTRTLYVRALPTLAQYTLELLSDTRPTAPITISKIEYRTLLGGVRYRDSIVYPVAWRYSSVANKYYAVTGFNVSYKDDPEQYPVSTSASAFENPYVYGFDSKPVDVVFSSRFTAFQQLENTRLINALSGRDYTSQLTAVAEKLDALANKSAVDLTTIESTLSTISDKLDNTASDVNNTIINITNDNDYFSVFYITDGDGNTRSVTDFAGALTGASGKLLSLLYRLVFADALGSVDGDLGNMEDFFTSEEPPPATAAMNGDTAPANEVIDVWAS